VPLQSSDLAATLQTYFKQSEQLETRLWLFANETHAVGLLLQELPTQNSDKTDWERIEILADTVMSRNCWSWAVKILLYRLFNEEKSGFLMLNRLSSSAPVHGQNRENLTLDGQRGPGKHITGTR